MKRVTISALVLCLGFATARGQDPDPVRAQMELVRQNMFLEISRPGASFAEQSANAARARRYAQAEFDRLMNGSPRPTSLSEKRGQLAGAWRGTAQHTDGSTSLYEMTVDGFGIMVNSITTLAPNGAVTSRRVFRGQMSYYKDGAVYVTALNGLSQQFSRLEWTDDNRFTLTTPGSHVSKYERVK